MSALSCTAPGVDTDAHVSALSSRWHETCISVLREARCEPNAAARSQSCGCSHRVGDGQLNLDGEVELKSDTVFIAYALILTAGVVSLITILMLKGFVT